MSARVPLDVDLEDKLIYGLSPTRFGYLVAAGLAAAVVWAAGWLPGPLRAALIVPAVLLGAALAWGRWRGRPADGWLADLAIFLRRNYRLRVDEALLERLAGALGRAARGPPRGVAGPPEPWTSPGWDLPP